MQLTKAYLQFQKVDALIVVNQEDIKSGITIINPRRSINMALHLFRTSENHLKEVIITHTMIVGQIVKTFIIKIITKEIILSLSVVIICLKRLSLILLPGH